MWLKWQSGRIWSCRFEEYQHPEVASIIHDLIPATICPDGPLTAVAINPNLVLVDVTKITIVLDSAFNVSFVKLDAYRLLQVGLPCDLRTLDPIVLARE